MFNDPFLMNYFNQNFELVLTVTQHQHLKLARPDLILKTYPNHTICSNKTQFFRFSLSEKQPQKINEKRKYQHIKRQ